MDTESTTTKTKLTPKEKFTKKQQRRSNSPEAKLKAAQSKNRVARIKLEQEQRRKLHEEFNKKSTTVCADIDCSTDNPTAPASDPTKDLE